jgi:hypothetical protein
VGGGLAALLGIGLQTFLAVALLAVGAVMVMGARWGRTRGLIAIGLVLAAAATLTSITDVSLAGGTGSRQIHPVVVRQLHPYRLGVGELQLDLRDLQLQAASTTVRARLGIGALTVYVPSDVNVVADTQVGIGQVDAFGRQDEGMTVHRTFRQRAAAEGGKQLRLDLDAGVGQINVEVR